MSPAIIAVAVLGGVVGFIISHEVGRAMPWRSRAALVAQIIFALVVVAGIIGAFNIQID